VTWSAAASAPAHGALDAIRLSVESLLRLAECTAAAGQPLMTPAFGIGNLGPNVAEREQAGGRPGFTAV
jgi:hypothetical protein